MAKEGESPDKSGGPIIDISVHLPDVPKALIPHCEMPWRKSLEIMSRLPPRPHDVSGYSPSIRSDPPIPPGTPEDEKIGTSQELRAGLDRMGTDAAVMLPDHLLHFALLAHFEFSSAVMAAYHRWVTSEWIDPAKGLYGVLIASPFNREATIDEIKRHADHPGVKGLLLPMPGMNPLWGHVRHDPILSAAEEAGLPVILQTVSAVTPSFPTNMEQFQNQFAKKALLHPFQAMAHMTSLIHTGVPAKHPKLQFVFGGAGLSWLPYMLARLDQIHSEYRRELPYLKEPPSAYLQRQMWFSTHKIETPQDAAWLTEAIRKVGADRIMFASGWPFHDHDRPSDVDAFALDADERARIKGGTAAEVFGIKAQANTGTKVGQSA